MLLIIREDINGKKRFLSGIARFTYPPPRTPIRATWSFFSDVKIQDLKVTWKRFAKNLGRGWRYINNLKNSTKFITLALHCLVCGWVGWLVAFERLQIHRLRVSSLVSQQWLQRWGLQSDDGGGGDDDHHYSQYINIIIVCNGGGAVQSEDCDQQSSLLVMIMTVVVMVMIMIIIIMTMIMIIDITIVLITITLSSTVGKHNSSVGCGVGRRAK